MSYFEQDYTLHCEEHDPNSPIKDCEWCPPKNQLTELLSQLDKEVKKDSYPYGTIYGVDTYTPPPGIAML